MENAHVLICLRDDDVDQPRGSEVRGDGRSPARSGVGVRRTSATSVRLEHSDMSPGVASISFEQVYDDHHTNAQIFEQSLADAVGRTVREGSAMTVVATGAARAGKSFCMHGDQGDNNNNVKGIVVLAIERAFAVASECDEWQVLLTTAYTEVDKVQDSGSLLDAFTDEPFQRDPVDTATCDSAFLSRALRVSNANEAVQAYMSALEMSTQGTKATTSADFVCVLYVESRTQSGVIHRSRLCFIDIHGNSIIEPTHTSSPHEDGKLSPFAETQFPVNGVLSQWCGAFVGNTSSTFLVVTIQTSTKKQQLAIQSLLYACKAKEVKSSVEFCDVKSFTVAPAFTSRNHFVDEPEDHDEVLMFLGSPVSSRSSNRSTSKREQSASDLLSERLRQAYQSVKKSTGAKSVELSPRIRTDVTSDAAMSNPGVTMTMLHSRADAILTSTESTKHSLETMTLLEKLERIAAQYRELEKSFQHEASVKKKCVERISKLSQTMSFQVVEHEKQLKARDAENRGLKVQLQNMQSMYDNAERTLETLQTQVEAMKMSMRERASVKSPARAGNERLLLQQFSARLETAMLEAKAVVDHKDAVIGELKLSIEQLEDTKKALEKAMSTEVIRFKENESRWETERARWEEQTAQWADAKAAWAKERARLIDEASQWRHKNARLIEEKNELEEEKVRWQRDISEARENVGDWVEKQSEWKKTEAHWMEEQAKWSDKQHALEAAVAMYREQLESEQGKTDEWADRLAVTEQTWEAKVLELQEALERERQDSLSLVKQKSELSSLQTTVVELECVVRDQEREIAQARDNLEALGNAKGLVEEQVSLLEAKLEEAQTTFFKEKKNLEKKLRILMTERKQQVEEAEKIESEMASEVKRLSLELEASRSECALKDSELARCTSVLAEVRERNGRLEKQCTISDEQISALHESTNRLEADKRSIEVKLEQLYVEKRAISEELERRTYALEQHAARQLVELETRLSSDYEGRVRDLMERQSSELLQRDLELARLRNRRPLQLVPVSSSSSSSSSSSVEHQQHDLDHLGAVKDSSSSRQHLKDKRLEDKISKQKKKIASLRNQLDSLTHALAVANEQESLAKEAIEQQQALYERMMYAQDELQTQVNALKEENWSLNLALQVTEKRTPHSGREEATFLPMSSRIAEC